jgi:hypothetical protein
MNKSQIHEDFISFRGTNLAALATEANTFLKGNNSAAKSLAVLATAGSFLLSIGYRSDEEFYPVGLVETNLNANADFDSAISDAAGDVDVICHALYQTAADGMIRVVFLVHQ